MVGAENSDPPPSSFVMTVLDVAAYLKISKYTVYRMARAASIPCVRIASDIRFNLEAIDRWRLVQETQPHPIGKRGPKPGKKRMKSQISSIQ